MAKIIRVNGQTEEVEPADGKVFSLKEMQEIVGGWIEIIYLRDCRVVVVNEEGRIRGLQHNESASQITVGQVFGNIVGDALVCSKLQLK